MRRSSHILLILRTSLPVFLLVVLCNGRMAGQSGQREFLPVARYETSLSPTELDSVISLPHPFIAANSETLTIDDSFRLESGRHYSIDYRWGIVRFTRLLQDSLGRIDSTWYYKVEVRYAYFPFNFRDSYFRRQVLVMRDSVGRDTLKIVRPTQAFTLDEIFGGDLQKSGSIVRGITVGTNRDLSLNSGLRMQLAGRLSSDIEIVAALTDENTPIQPEGTTQTLQEFDKVFVEMRSSDVTATLGDFNIDIAGTEFARLNRKLK